LPNLFDELFGSPRAGAILAGPCRNVDAISATYPSSYEIDAADGHERFGQGA
jgi:glycogen operon protein